MQPGAVVGEAWDLYRRHWLHFVSIAFVVFLLLSLLTLLLAAILGIFGGFLGLLLSIAGIFWLQGALVEAVADVRDGRVDLSIGETLGRIRPRLNTLGVAGVLAVLGVSVGLALLIVPGLVLITWWVLIVPVIVLEGASILDAFGRSRELVRGNGWNVFGVIVLTFLLYLVAWIAIGIAFFWLPDWLRGFVTQIVGGSVTAPLVAIAWTLTYYRLRGEGATAR